VSKGIDSRARAIRPTLFITLCAGLVSSASAADWPNYRGPTYDGKTPESIVVWPPTELWRANVGQGYSGVTVSNGKVFTAGWASGQDTVYKFDANYSDGGTQTAEATYSYDCGTVAYNGARATPSIDVARNLVYMFSHEGKLVCMSSIDMSHAWTTDLGTGGRPGWGFASSVLVEGDLLIVNKDGAGTAVDRTTHAVVWGGQNNGAGYATPFAFDNGGQRTVVVFANPNVSGVDPLTGTVLWYFGFNQGMADPIISNGFVWASVGYGPGVAVRKLGSGALTIDEANEYNSAVMGNKENCSVYHNGYVYGIDEYTGLRCIRFSDGNVMWTNGTFGAESSIMMAGGEFLVMTGRDSGSGNGDLVVVQASSSAYTELHRWNDILGLGAGAKTWTAPTVADGKLYLRSESGLLVCYDVVNTFNPTVTIASTPTGRSITVDTSSTIVTPEVITWAAGSTHTVAVPSPQGESGGVRYAFASWSANANFSDPTYTMPAVSDTLTAHFQTEYQLLASVTPSGYGTIVGGDNMSWHVSGTSLTIAATPAAGSVFDHWTGSLTSRLPSTTLAMSAPRDITAVFEDDGDNDGMADAWETANQLDPLDPLDGVEDADGDGVSNADEYRNGSDPNSAPAPSTDSGSSGLSCASSSATAGGIALVAFLIGLLLASTRALAQK
jgi:outer membrane protein assembly factor BamB